MLLSGVVVPEEENYGDQDLMYRTASVRWERLGIPEEQRKGIHASWGKTLFSVLGYTSLKAELAVHGLSAPREVFRGLSNVMWSSEKKKEAA